jgi:hypothetical protein
LEYLFQHEKTGSDSQLDFLFAKVGIGKTAYFIPFIIFYLNNSSDAEYLHNDFYTQCKKEEQA